MYTKAPALSIARQDLAYRIWNELISASEAHFLRNESAWAGDSRAPEFSDEAIEKQFRHWDAYRTDAGAMGWRGNDRKAFAHDFTALPSAIKRAVCERVWVLCKEARLDEDAEYRETVEAWSAAKERGAGDQAAEGPDTTPQAA